MVCWPDSFCGIGLYLTDDVALPTSADMQRNLGILLRVSGQLAGMAVAAIAQLADFPLLLEVRSQSASYLIRVVTCNVSRYLCLVTFPSSLSESAIRAVRFGRP